MSKRDEARRGGRHTQIAAGTGRGRGLALDARRLHWCRLRLRSGALSAFGLDPGHPPLGTCDALLGPATSAIPPPSRSPPAFLPPPPSRPPRNSSGPHRGSSKHAPPDTDAFGNVPKSSEIRAIQTFAASPKMLSINISASGAPHASVPPAKVRLMHGSSAPARLCTRPLRTLGPRSPPTASRSSQPKDYTASKAFRWVMQCFAHGHPHT